VTAKPFKRGPEGSGPPPHSHPWDESFFVVKGEIDFGIDDESQTASRAEGRRLIRRHLHE